MICICRSRFDNNQKQNIQTAFSMSVFHTILSQFNRLSLTDKHKVQQQQMVGYLNQLARMNTRFQGFDSDIGEQLWQHSNKTPQGKVLIKDYIQTVIDARNILAENLAKSQKQLRQEDDPNKKQQIEEYLLSYKEDLQILSDTFQLQAPSAPSPIASAASGVSGMKNRQSDEESGIFADLPSSRDESLSLKWVLILTIMMLCLEFLCMQARDHFTNLLVYTAIICIFFLGYFDRTYMKSVLLMLGVATVLDLIWLIIMAPVSYLLLQYYWYQSNPSLLTTHQSGFLIAVYVLTVSLMCGKGVLFLLLFRFRKNDFMTKKEVNIFSFRLFLDGKDVSNPLTAIFGDSGSATKSYD